MESPNRNRYFHARTDPAGLSARSVSARGLAALKLHNGLRDDCEFAGLQSAAARDKSAFQRLDRKAFRRPVNDIDWDFPAAAPAANHKVVTHGTTLRGENTSHPRLPASMAISSRKGPPLRISRAEGADSSNP